MMNRAIWSRLEVSKSVSFSLGISSWNLRIHSSRVFSFVTFRSVHGVSFLLSLVMEELKLARVNQPSLANPEVCSLVSLDGS